LEERMGLAFPKPKRWKRPKVGKLGIIRLSPKDRAALRLERYDLDKGKCVDCGRPLRRETGYWDSMHMAHIVGVGRGGSDVIGNVQSKCGECHLVKEHNPKSVPPKPVIE
jgi:5-methylcytosine-specific restriction endonuclease McrA